MKGGRTRTALTDAEKQGRDLVVSWMKALDLVIRIDQIGNIFGTLPSVSGNSDTAPLMIGSHIDTVINAGALDGCYGVLSGLAVVRAFREAGVLPSRPITVAAFTNEEGVRFHPDMMGSLVYAGGYPLEDALNTVATDGAVLRDELERAGYAGSMVPGSIVPHEYLELHIEQGPVLEAEGLQIGVVESLQGISWQKITITGTANHAGTTPTRLRHDAGYAAAKLITFLREGISQKNGATLTTVGTIAFEPNAVNVIPARQRSPLICGTRMKSACNGRKGRSAIIWQCYQSRKRLRSQSVSWRVFSRWCLIKPGQLCGECGQSRRERIPSHAVRCRT